MNGIGDTSEKSTIDWTHFDRFWPVFVDVMSYLPLGDRFAATRTFQWELGLRGGWNNPYEIAISQDEFLGNPGEEHGHFNLLFDLTDDMVSETGNLTIKLIWSQRPTDIKSEQWYRRPKLCLAEATNEIDICQMRPHEISKVLETFKPIRIAFNVQPETKVDISPYISVVEEYPSVMHVAVLTKETVPENNMTISTVNIHELLRSFPNAEAVDIHGFHWTMLKSYEPLTFRPLSPKLYNVSIYICFTKNDDARPALICEEELLNGIVNYCGPSCPNQEDPVQLYLHNGPGHTRGYIHGYQGTIKGCNSGDTDNTINHFFGIR